MGNPTTRNEIREILLDAWAEIENATYPDDVVASYAESETPIYNNDVISEWAALPWDATDAWKEYGYDANKNTGGILQLMAVDLTIYYLEQFRAVYEEIKAEKEEMQAVIRAGIEWGGN